MQIKRTSMFSGQTNTKDLAVTQEQLDAYKAGALLQDAFPDLPAEDREFIKTGITPEEWAAQFPEPDLDTKIADGIEEPEDFHDRIADGVDPFGGDE